MNVIKELWHGNIVPQEDSRTNTKEMKELLGYIARHHEDLDKTFTAEQKELYEKLHDCWDEYVSLTEAAIFEYAFKLGMNIAIVYDFYIPELEAIIEVHGSQHYGQGFEKVGGRTLEEEQINDRLKEDLAKQNGIKH